MPPDGAPATFGIAGNGVMTPGYLFGLDHPCVQLPVLLPALTGAETQALAAGFREGFAAIGVPLAGGTDLAGADAAAAEAAVPASLLLACFHHLQTIAGLMLTQPGVLVRRGGSNRPLVLAIPTVQRASQRIADGFGQLLAIAARLHAGQPAAGIAEELDGIRALMQPFAPGSGNTAGFLGAATAAGLPFSQVVDDVYQFGQGHRGHWLQSSTTERSSAVALRMSRSKHATATLLRAAGLPVPPNGLAGSAAEAVAVARRIGYPVVVKPADQDGAVGVTTAIADDDAVARAFARARAQSSHILVERQLDGREYRLTVVDGDLVAVIERHPGGVTGDGRRSVRALLDALNREPDRGPGRDTPRNPLPLDAEAETLLAGAGLTPDSVPDPGRFVRLRWSVNVTVGGTSRRVHAPIHPDNRDLALRAAAAVRLDIAGIDLIIPDIRRSWMAGGGGICEVNGRPSFSPLTSADVFRHILARRVAGTGRVPTAVLLGAADGAALGNALCRALSDGGLTAGHVHAGGCELDGQRLTPHAATVQEGGRMLLADRRCRALVVSLADADILHCGLPCDRVDLLVLAGIAVAPTGRAPALIGALFDAMAPMLADTVLIAQGSGIALGANPTLPAGLTVMPAVPAATVLPAALACLQAAERRHAGARPFAPADAAGSA